MKHLEVRGETTVGELKKLIHQHFGAAVVKQKLSADNGPVSVLRMILKPSAVTDCTLDQWSVCSSPTLDLSKCSSGMRRARPKRMMLMSTRPVDQLQTKIYNKERVPVDQQRLIFNGRQLESGTKLQEYDIASGSTIHMTLRLRGG